MQPVASAGKHATGPKRGKTCNQPQARENMQSGASAGKQMHFFLACLYFFLYFNSSYLSFWEVIEFSRYAIIFNDTALPINKYNTRLL